MSDKSVKIFVRNSEWYNRAKERGAKIIANGMTSMIVITENRYFYGSCSIKGGAIMKEWILTIYHDFGPVEIRCESINNALHVIKARREIFPGSIYKLAHKEYKK